MSMPSPAMNLFDMGKVPVCEHICLQRLLSVSKLLCALLLPPSFVCLQSSVSCISTSAASLFQRLDRPQHANQHGGLSYMTHELTFIVIIHRHSSTSSSIIHRPSSTSFIIIHRHSSTSSIIIHLTLSFYLLLPNSFPLLAPAFLSGHTAV